jgi:hypothetical protein
MLELLISILDSDADGTFDNFDDFFSSGDGMSFFLPS